MGRNYVSTMFNSGEEFEAWIKEVKDKTPEWDNKAVALSIVGDKLNLVSADGTVLASVDYSKTDNQTITVDNNTGVITAVGLKEKNSGKIFSVWIGTQKQYETLATKEDTTWYIITDDDTLNKIGERIGAVEDRTTALEERATGIENRVKTLENSTPASEDDITRIDRDIDDIQSDVATVKGDINKIKNGNTTVQNATYATSAMYANGQTAKGTLATRLTNLETDTANIKNGTTAVGNATKVNNLEIKQDENGVLKIGDIIIPQKKLLCHLENTTRFSLTEVSINESWIGKKIEIEYSLYEYFENDNFAYENQSGKVVCTVDSVAKTQYLGIHILVGAGFVSKINAIGSAFGCIKMVVYYDTNDNKKLHIDYKCDSESSDFNKYLTDAKYTKFKIYEIIE